MARDSIGSVYPARASAERRVDIVFVWRGGRVVEGARLERVYRATYPGFESLPLRHYFSNLIDTVLSLTPNTLLVFTTYSVSSVLPMHDLRPVT